MQWVRAVKFTINSGLLTETVSAAISSLSSNPTSPIMGGVLIEAQLGAVTFSSFNGDRASIRTSAADVAEPDTAVVSGRLLAVVGGNLPKNAESCVACSGSEMVVATGRTEFRLPLLHTADYPALPVMASTDRVGSVGCDAFSDAVRAVSGFASTEPQPVEITALNIATEPGVIVLCATDRYVIVRRRLPWSGTGSHVMNVPATDLQATIKAVAGPAGDVEILSAQGRFGMRTPSTTVVTRTLGADFPNMGRFLDKTEPFHSSVTVPTQELASMLKRASAVADDKNAQVDIAVDGGTFSVTTTHASVGKVTDETSVIHHGGARKLALSSRRLLSILTAIDDPQVSLAFEADGWMVSIYPGRIEPEGDIIRRPATNTTAVLIGIRGVR